MSVASDQPSSYNLSFLRDGELREDDEENNCPAAAADLQCEEETDGPVYVNTAALAAAAAGGDDDDDDNGGDTADSEYMHVLDYGAVSTFHDDFCEARLSMLCTGNLDLTAENCHQ